MLTDSAPPSKPTSPVPRREPRTEGRVGRIGLQSCLHLTALYHDGHRPADRALGEEFAAFLYDACVNILTVTKGAVYMCMSSSELDTLQKAFREAGGKWSTFVIWAKNSFTLGRSDYQRQYEPILYGWKQGVDHYWCGDRDQSDVWFFDKPTKNDLHPTMKPVALVERAIRNSSKTRDIVLDPFGGSGTTLIAAERTGRRGRLTTVSTAPMMD